MKKNIFLTAGLLCCFVICLAMSASMEGRWAGSLKAPDGNPYPLFYNFKVNGNHLSGTAVSFTGQEVDIEDGKIDGDKFTFSLPLRPAAVPHEGKFYGDSIGVDLTVHNEKFHVVLTRSK
jgi:hypothetical protein